VDEIHEVIPLTEDYGLWHPQEGVVNGHYRATEPQKIQKLGQLRQGVVKVLEDATYTPSLARKYTVADLITGYGVAEAVRHYYALWGDRVVAGKRVIIQGWGNVGAAAAYYLASQGARIVGIIDRAGGLLRPEGLTLEEVRELFLNRHGNALHAPGLLPFEEINQKIWSAEAEIFVPAAASRLVTQPQVEALVAAGLEVISCGANVPFADPAIFFGPTGEWADAHCAVIPDFIANCGMARVFAYLMETGAEITDQAIFSDTSRVIEAALTRTRRQSNDTTGIAQRSFEMALRQLV
jgi:glutamate dehydrogenase/leucine dehydrogenase